MNAPQLAKAVAILASIMVPCRAESLLVNEIDPDQPGTDTMEFVELFGTPNMSLNGCVVVFFNGNTDTSYAAFDLDGYHLGATVPYFLLGNPLVVIPMGGDIEFPINTLQNGPDAVALYWGDAGDFPNGTAVTSTNLIDAVVYGGNDAGLQSGFGVQQSTIPVDSNVNPGSIGRVPEGAFDTWQFKTQIDPFDSGVPKVVGVSGDYNANGIVDAADNVVWRNTVGLTGAGRAADGDGNSIVGAGDYDVWKAHFGQAAGSGAGSAVESSHAAVPEPATLALVFLGGVVLLIQRLQPRHLRRY